MSNMDLWWLSLLLGGVVVVAVAVLLLLIIATARRIDRHAAAIWTIGKEIAGNTVSLSMLEQTAGSLAGVKQSLNELRSGFEAFENALHGNRRAP